MKYPQIMSRVFREPWLIQPRVHETMQRTLLSRIGGNHQAMITDDEDGPQDDGRDEVQDYGGVRIIPVHGILGKHLDSIEMMCGGCSVDRICEAIEIAKHDTNVRAVLFDFRSPGGTVCGIPECADAIAEIGKPTIGFTDSLCCSGAMWLAAQCDEFYATRSACIGSVGVYVYLEDWSKALEQEGIKPNPISAGEFKLLGAYFKPLTDAERAIVQASVNKTHAEFKAVVKSKRPVEDQYLEGQDYDGEEATAHGLVSGIVHDFDEAVAFAVDMVS